jgi:hypothetical protein
MILDRFTTSSLIATWSLAVTACVGGAPAEQTRTWQQAVAATDSGRPDGPVERAPTSKDAGPGEPVLPPWPVPIGDESACSRPDPDLGRAQRVLTILGLPLDGGELTACASCHPVGNRWQLEWWRTNTTALYTQCLDANLPLSAQQRIDCLRSYPNYPSDPSAPATDFSAVRLGLYAAAAAEPEFRQLFIDAFPADGDARHRTFVEQVAMPPATMAALSSEQIVELIDWSRDGMPGLACALSADDAPTECVDAVSADLRAHVERRRVVNWHTVNLDRDIDMFGCEGVSDPLNCFGRRRDGVDVFAIAQDTEQGSGWAGQIAGATLRIVQHLPDDTTFWMRSSADGRFVANGGSPSTIVDLLGQLVGRPRVINVAATYDPGFFPDNSGFMYQGTPAGAGLCRQSLLEDPATTEVSFSEPQCAGSDAVSAGLYQSVAAGLDSGDYVIAVGGQWSGDAGSGGTSDGIPYYDRWATVELIPVLHTGQRYEPLAATRAVVPYLGDIAMSPSTELLFGRIAGRDPGGPPAQMGYRFYRVDRLLDADQVRFKLHEVGTICLRGNKPTLSFDERFLTTYHYLAAEDYAEYGFASPKQAEFQALLAAGAANIYLRDLLGHTHRVTTMGPGQFALFPHFRSDGWLYFQVYDRDRGQRTIVASDAALRLLLAAPAIQ